jgi:hypothetical protein
MPPGRRYKEALVVFGKASNLGVGLARRACDEDR